jgi:hypothetical protein
VAWNEDGWRVAHEAFARTREAVEAMYRALETLRGEHPDISRRLNIATGVLGRDLGSAARAVRAREELPSTEPEARRILAACQRFKELLVENDSEIATWAREGSRELTLDDRAALVNAGWLDALRSIQEVEWAEVTRLQAVPQAAPRQPSTPRDPTRARRRGAIEGLLPLAFLFVVMMSSNRR